MLPYTQLARVGAEAGLYWGSRGAVRTSARELFVALDDVAPYRRSERCPLKPWRWLNVSA